MPADTLLTLGCVTLEEICDVRGWAPQHLQLAGCLLESLPPPLQLETDCFWTYVAIVCSTLAAAQ